jgi:hypothetical protein
MFTWVKNKEILPAKIIGFTEEYGSFEVGTLVLDGQHIYIANGILCHNRKADPDEFNF